MKNKKLLHTLGAGAVALGAIGSMATFALAETTTPATTTPVVMTQKHHQPSTEEQAQMKSMHAAMKALEANDYKAFQTAAVGNTKLSAITQDQFNTVVAAQKILKDAGLMPQVKQMGGEMMKGKAKGNMMKKIHAPQAQTPSASGTQVTQ